MIGRLVSFENSERRAIILAVIIVAQALCGMFFISDVIADFAERKRLDDAHLIVETIAAFALFGGVIWLMLELRWLLAKMTRMETGIRAARGEMADIIEHFFSQWALSPAERDVALFLLKGLDSEAIAALRGTAKGTIRAQSASIYAKAGVDSRAQLVSLFLEELLASERVPQHDDPG